jgi:hypothetical protein
MKHSKTKKAEMKNAAAVAVDQTARDAVTALLIVSLLVNMYVLIAWVTLQVTSVYDAEVAAFLFVR